MNFRLCNLPVGPTALGSVCALVLAALAPVAGVMTSVSVALIAVVALAVVYVVNQMMQRLRQLLDDTNAIANGELTREIRDHGLNEIGRLANSVEQMRCVITNQEKELRNAGEILDKRQVELEKEIQNRKVVEQERDGISKQLTVAVQKDGMVEIQEINRKLQASNERLQYEISEKRKVEDRLRHDTLHDPLTHLPNRTLLMDRLGRVIERAKRNIDHQYAVLFVDMDNFKLINDSFGHRVGDELLVEVGKRIAASIRGLDTTARPSDDTTARVGGDEFVILLDGIKHLVDSELVATRIQRAVAEPLMIGGSEITARVSIGISTSAHGYSQPEDVLRDADTALYEAKAEDKGMYKLFDELMRERSIKRLQMENDLNFVVERRQLVLNYQPIMSLQAGVIEGFEALVRWQHPERGLISPADFVPVAEETGLIVPIGSWILEEACHQLKTWRENYPQYANLTMSVNVSPKQLRRREFHGEIRAILNRTGLEANAVNLEITETCVLDQNSTTNDFLQAVRKDGFGLHLDDFGTGFSSLSHLHDIPITALKVDRSFVDQMGLDGEHAATIQAIQTLAANRGFKVIVEGIETLEQLVQIQVLDCDCGQGYYFSRPVNAEDADRLLAVGWEWRAAS